MHKKELSLEQLNSSHDCTVVEVLDRIVCTLKNFDQVIGKIFN